MKLPRNGEKKVRVEMTPFMDVMFLLLVFFIYAMLSMSVHRGVPVRLPESSQAALATDPALSVTVTADEGVFLDKEPVDVAELTTVLIAAVKGMQEPSVDLFAAREVRYQALFRVMDRITAAGIHRVSLQAMGAEEAAP